jgi:hypothetical protein
VRAKVRALEGVKQVFIFENTSTDKADGLPAKSFEVVVRGGDDDEIARTIFLTKPVGIEAYADVSSEKTVIKNVEDSQGILHEIKFRRPKDVPIYIDVAVKVDRDIFFPADLEEGKRQIRQALVNLGETLTIGDDIIALRFRCVPLEIPGVIDVEDFKIAKNAPPQEGENKNITIDKRDVAEFDTGRINVTVPP